jgi:hypothetical protein
VTIIWTYGLEKYYKRTRKKRTNFTSEYDPPESRVVETGNEYIDHYDESERIVINLLKLTGFMRFPKDWLKFMTSSNIKSPISKYAGFDGFVIQEITKSDILQGIMDTAKIDGSSFRNENEDEKIDDKTSFKNFVTHEIETNT